MIKYKIDQDIQKSNCLILPLFEGKGLDKNVKNLDKQFNGLISQSKEEKDFEGKKLQSMWLLTGDKKISRLLLIGLGKEKDFNISVWKRAIGSATILAQNKKFKDLSFNIPQLVFKKFEPKKIGQETISAIEVASYSYDEFKTDEKAKIVNLKTVEFISDLDKKKIKQFEKGLEDGQIISSGVNFTRHLGNVPPTIMTPSFLAKEAQKLSKNNSKVKIKILSRDEMDKSNMGCLLGVARGSKLEPKFIIVEYNGADKKQKPVVLVGKGITYDSGGLSLKPGSGLPDMKFDMLGGASVLGIMKSLIDLKVNKNVVALIPAAENMPGGDAYRPDDILQAMNGKTIEVKNTDAEGRLVLADALSYASKYEPKQVIDLATLTGACMAALGLERSGIFTSEDKMSENIIKSGENVGEKLWRLPLGEEYSEAIKSEVADIKNLGGVGGERYGIASTAAAFLQEFTDYPWVHIDLASVIYSSKGKPWIRVGANGEVVQTLIKYLR